MLYKLINQALDKYLSSDPETAQRLNEFNEKSLVLELTDLNLKTRITIHENTIVLEKYTESETDEIHASIQSNVISLLQIGMGADYQSMINSDLIKITGDADLINQVRVIFKDIDIDWEEIVSKYLGDSVAYQAGVMAKKVNDYKKRSLENFRLDVSEYLQEESRIVPTRVELEHFFSDVDTLEADIERLEARAQRLIEKCESK